MVMYGQRCTDASQAVDQAELDESALSDEWLDAYSRAEAAVSDALGDLRGHNLSSAQSSAEEAMEILDAFESHVAMASGGAATGVGRVRAGKEVSR